MKKAKPKLSKLGIILISVAAVLLAVGAIGFAFPVWYTLGPASAKCKPSGEVSILCTDIVNSLDDGKGNKGCATASGKDDCLSVTDRNNKACCKWI